MTEDTWGRAQVELEKTVGGNNFKNWIDPLIFSEVRDGVAIFHVPTNFMGNWVNRNFGELILRHLIEAGAKVQRVAFEVSGKAPIKPVARNHETKSAARASKPGRMSGDDLLGASLDERFTFDRFVVGKPNELAHAAARRVAEGGPVTFNPLFLYGGVGLGKTHLMHAIAWELQKRNADLRVLYLSANQFMYSFVRALRDKQTMDFKQLFRSVDVLIVDDVQFLAGKEGTQEEFFH
ncbi:MAG TPA: AAA family ATPase, partial [Rhodobacteraceae bacterium]|nr:AAA family ATPase [Paracoccaceae bacterium]